MGKRTEKLEALLVALRASQGKAIAVEELAAAAGYHVPTLRSYVQKHMLVPRVTLVDDGRCKVGDLEGFTLGDLRRALSQRKNRYTWEHLSVSELVSSLLDRSRTNAGLALELINRPELANRLDAFVLLFHTAWEQLLKADLEQKEPGSVFTGGTSSSGRPATIGMATALERTFPSTKDPVRRNIEWLKELRDGATHLLVPELTGIATRYFQASVLNYIARFQDLTGEPPFRFEGTGLLTLGVAYSSPSLDALRVSHGTHAPEVLALIARLEEEADEAKDARFAVTIEYQLVLDKKPGPGAIRLVTGPGGAAARPVFVPKDPKERWPHRATECANILTTKTGITWSNDAVVAVAELLGVREGDNEHHYRMAYGTQEIHLYSEPFIELVQERLRQDPDLVARARERRRRPRPKGAFR